MIGKLNALADRVLARIVPQTTAAACSHTYDDYMCDNYNRRYHRTCYRDTQCYTTRCTEWVHEGHC
jgi:hypothetical protein